MFTEDKVTEILCIADDFCKFYDAMMAKYTIKEQKKREEQHEGSRHEHVGQAADKETCHH